MNFFCKIKAGSLQFVLFIGAVIAVLLVTFVLLSHSHSFFSKKTGKYIAVIQKGDFALQMALKEKTNSSETKIAIADDGIVTETKKTLWGVFEKYQVKSKFKKSVFQKQVLVGTGITAKTPALFLKDNQRPLIIVGAARITGDAFLPQQGIRPGNIAGESYFSSSLIYGRQKASTAELPILDNKIQQQITLLSSGFIPTNVKSDEIQLFKNTELKNSFAAPTQYIRGTHIDLSGAKLTGNIIVQASNEIRLDASSQLRDILLVAPKILIDANTQGTFQAFASSKITVGKNCKLDYPSALVVQKKLNSTTSANSLASLPDISIESGTIIKGLILYKSEEEERLFYPQLKLQEQATVVGQVYCEKNLELKGKVIGSVYTDSFMALENGNVYQNHLYKGTIDCLSLHKEFVGLSFEFEGNKKIAKWLY